MVWFQCEDCGENLKKPKLPNHFRICSASKLSCIDCGETFNQQSVQGHTQCISEAEKYGPKDQGKSPHSVQNKVNKKPNLDIDVNVGLSTYPPWFCSLCNTNTTSKQTLLLHADGKKHRAKARAHHAAQKQSCQTEESNPNKDNISEPSKVDSVEASNTKNSDEISTKDPLRDTFALIPAEKESLLKKKRKLDASEGGIAGNQVNSGAGELANGEVIQADRAEAKSKTKRNKCADSVSQSEDHLETNGHVKEAPDQKIKWKKLVTAILKSNSEGVLKMKKLQKLVAKALQESGVTDDKALLREKLMNKIASSSRFVIDGKHIHLARKD